VVGGGGAEQGGEQGPEAVGLGVVEGGAVLAGAVGGGFARAMWARGFGAESGLAQGEPVAQVGVGGGGQGGQRAGLGEDCDLPGRMQGARAGAASGAGAMPGRARALCSAPPSGACTSCR